MIVYLNAIQTLRNKTIVSPLIVSENIGDESLIIKGAESQNADILVIRDSTDNDLFAISADGTLIHKMTGSVYTWSYQANVGDDSSFSLPSGISSGAKGWFMVGNNEEYVEFLMDSTGTVSLLANTTMGIIENSDTNGYLCIGTSAPQFPLIIKNRLGSEKSIFGEITYY